MRGGGAQPAGELVLAAPLVHAGDDERGRGGSTHTGEAVDEHRRASVPRGGEVHDEPHVAGVGQDGAREGLDDVVAADEEVMLGAYSGRRGRIVFGDHQGEDMARPRLVHVARHLLEAADVHIRA